MRAERIPPRAKAPLSPIKTFAGLMLKKRKAPSTATKIPTTVVAIYVPLRKVTSPSEVNMIIIRPPASPSSPSVMLIAFTIAIVAIKVKIGNQSQISIFPPKGQRFM